MSENLQPSQQGLVIANILPSLRNMPAILEEHKARVAGASNAAQKLIDFVSASEKISEDHDLSLMNMIIRIKDAVEVMEGEYKPLTSMMTEITRMFTGEKGKLTPFLETMQQLRNKRARQVAEDEALRKKEADQKAAKGLEYANLKGFIIRNIEEKLAAKKADRKTQFMASFNQITLDNIVEKEAAMRALRQDFPFGKLAEILNYFILPQKYHPKEEVEAIDKKLREEYDWVSFEVGYKKDLEDFIADLLVRLPSKKAELTEAKRLADEKERLRLEREENERQERALQQQRLQASKAQQEKLDKEAQRLREEKKEQERQRLENEQKEEEQKRIQQARENEAARLLEEQRARERQAAANKGDAAQAVAAATTLFDQVSEAAPSEKGPESRKGYELEIFSPAAYAELFQFWFTEEGPALWQKDRAKFEKMSFEKLVTFAEKMMLKGKKIESKFFIYNETYTSVNRKEKKEA